MESAKLSANRLGLFRTNAFVAAGFPREYLGRLVERGLVQRIGRGLYMADSFECDQHQSLLEATVRFPQAVVCLFSALQFHGIGTQVPFTVWLALPASSREPRTAEQLPVRFCKFSANSHSYGVKRHPVAGGTLPVYSPAKTVADCFKYRNKFGIDVAVEALREGWRAKQFSLTEIKQAADACRVGKVIQPYLEMLA